ncbi:translesion DNA synthesis-associated protein ImuA [Comamonas sp. NLF-1-9]|uniref:translesion DNA synthesis-associated protein ImuA n=1 Tax=Comamonas sp. NLF-1-9 TaxID=2853163 RepID=UPI001C452496|nr:translesion DNA synthesis-associated protein ImuA [Comamonas sp. NLF-1-9]QXL85336.1 translesion DNA synthesis-associated protein ImuA [Comamonas sp. NLF-1-9]
MFAPRPLVSDDPRPALASLPAQVWRGGTLGAAEGAVLPSSHAPLDAELPGGGWPLGALVELLQRRPGLHEWALLLPALAQLAEGQRGVIALVGAPHLPFGPALAARGLPAERLLCITTTAPLQRLWAAEQALRCPDVLALLLWLPHAQDHALRRLHLAARGRARPLFALRPHAARTQPSPAPLRLLLEGDGESLKLDLFKRHGPPLGAPLHLPAQPPALRALLAASRQPREAPRKEALQTPHRPAPAQALGAGLVDGKSYRAQNHSARQAVLARAV